MRIPLILIACIILFGCQDPYRAESDRIRREFDSVQASIAPSINAYHMTRTDYVYKAIQAHKDVAPAFAKTADSIYARMGSAKDYLGQLHDQLERLDSAGSNMDVTEKLLVNTPTGKQLTMNMVQVYDMLTQYPLPKPQADSLHDLQTAHLLAGFKTDPNFLSYIFRNVPTVAGKAICGGLQQEIDDAGLFVLHDLLRKADSTVNTTR